MSMPPSPRGKVSAGRGEGYGVGHFIVCTYAVIRTPYYRGRLSRGWQTDRSPPGESRKPYSWAFGPQALETVSTHRIDSASQIGGVARLQDLENSRMSLRDFFSMIHAFHAHEEVLHTHGDTVHASLSREGHFIPLSHRDLRFSNSGKAEPKFIETGNTGRNDCRENDDKSGEQPERLWQSDSSSDPASCVRPHSIAASPDRFYLQLAH